MPAPVPYCPDPSLILPVPEVTRLAPEKSQEERAKERAVERAKSQQEEDHWKAGIPLVTETEGKAAFLLAYNGGVDAHGKRVFGADPQQRQFIDACENAQENAIIQGVACAGAGKTASVVLGVAAAYYKGVIPPNQIVVTTFTKKASRELQERLCKYIPKTIVFSQMRVGTFHSGRVSGQGLRNAQVSFAGKTLITDLTGILRQILGRAPMGGTPFVANVEGVEYRDLGDDLGGLATGAKIYNSLISNKFEPWGVNSPEEVRAYLASVKNPDDLERGERERYDNILAAKELSADEQTFPAFPAIWRDALRVKEARKEYTFNDMLATYLTVADRDRARLLICDEAQDNSWVQMHICLRVARASKGTLLMVGDGRQSIFAFRGADSTIFQYAQQDYNANRREIGTNYRSGYWIIEAGNEICRDDKGQTFPWAIGEPAVTGRRNADGTPVHGVIMVGHYNSQTKTVGGAIQAEEHWETHEEAFARRKKGGKGGKRIQIAGEIPTGREIATRINAAIEGGRKAEDFAILTRTNAALGPFELALSRYRIPVVYAGSKVNFMSRVPITRMLRLLALCAPGVVEDPEMAARMLGSVLKDDGGVWYGKRFKFMANDAFFGAVRQNWSRGILPTIEALGRVKDRRGKENWRSGAEDFAAELAPLQDASWPEAASLAADILSSWEKLQRDEDESEDEDALKEPDEDEEDSFYQSLADIGATFDTYTEFMTYVEKARRTQTKGEDDKVEGGACVLSTAHRSKGLQWPVVYILASAGIWPHARAFKKKDQEEERRLYYVAVTRAADELHVWSTGEGSSPFTVEVFGGRIFPRMEKARIEAERAKRLAEVEIRDVGGGWAVFRKGVRLSLQGISRFVSYEAAETAYLAPHEEGTADAEAPFASQIRMFLDWLGNQAPEVARHLLARPHHIALLEALFADSAVTSVLGWSLLAELFPEHTGDVEVLSREGKLLGYLLRPQGAQPAVFHGYLELRVPFEDYTVRGFTPQAGAPDPTIYGTRFEDYSPELLNARYSYATLLPEDRVALGAAVPLEAPVLQDVPLVDFGPTAAQIILAETGVPEAPPQPEVAIPVEVTLASPEDTPPEAADPREAPRRLLPLTLPSNSGWGLVIVNAQGTLLGTFSLSSYREYPVLERAIIRHTSEERVTTIYRVMAGSVDRQGRVVAELQQVAGGDSDFKLSKLDLRPLAQDTLDIGLRSFLASPGIESSDQLLWEAVLAQPFRVDLGRFSSARGAPLTPFGFGGLGEAQQRLQKSGWFDFQQTARGIEVHWQMRRIQQIYGEGAWLG